MTIKEIEEKIIWEDFLLKCTEKTFCQSWNWGEFNKAMGDRIWRFGIFEGEELIAVSNVIKVKAKRGIFLFVPHGPVILKGEAKEVIKALLDYLIDLGKKEKAVFIRFSPILERNENNAKILRELGMRNAPIHMHPELTWELDATLNEDELLKGMRKTTRYLVKQGEKNPDIEIVQSCDEKDLDDFERVYLETAGRHSFTPFSMKYLKKELESFKDDNEIVIFSGKYKGETVSSAMIVYWSKRAFYHQGASSLKYSKIPVSYLLQWEAIKEAKKRGCELYNFWGVVPEIEKNHPWAGLSLFKKGFGGKEKEYVKTQDYILSPLYWLTYAFEELRKRKRHL
jgi:lipid II:glycine glycyltransferase (peptidoglycan interpeptide bridge formation enzyme)